MIGTTIESSFRKFIALIVSFSLIAFTAVPVKADSQSNLIANPSLESSVAGQPSSWFSENWGSNTASFSYLNTGHTGSHAVQTTVSDYVSGDAKWIFTPVSVAGGEQYTYSDWYKSTATTNIWAQYRNSDGTYSYEWLEGIGVSNNWAYATDKLTIPDGVVAVSIFHVLNANGQLIIDDANLALTPVCNTSQSNGIYDGGFEETCPGSPDTPANWHTETYGDPGANFSYITDSHTGSRAVQTNLSSPNGEAGWQSDWQYADSNQRYGLRFWHQDSTYIYAYVAITLQDGSLQYISLMSVPSTEGKGWSQYNDNFVTPSNTKTIQITIATSGVGTFSLDDVYIDTLTNQTPTDFDQGVVTVTFDDGDASTYKNGFSVLKGYGLKGTFYINASTLGTQGYMSKTNIKSLAQDGQEVGSHLYEHVDMVSLSNNELQQQIVNNNDALHVILGSNYSISSLASPYGAYTSETLDTAMQYYGSHRTTDGRFNTKANLNDRQIHAVLVQSNTTAAQVETWVSQAQQQHEWLVLVYHAIGSSPSGGDGSDYATTTANFKSEMNYIHTDGIKVMPVDKALEYLKAQE